MDIFQLKYFLLLLSKPLLLGLISYYYSNNESKGKPHFLFDNEHDKLIVIGISVVFVHFFLVYVLVVSKILPISEVSLLSLFVRIGLGFYVSNSADSLGRSKVFWGIIGFLDSFVAFVALGASVKLFSHDENTNEQIFIINDKIITKQNAINELKNNGLIDDAEFNNKMQELKSEYFEDVNVVIYNNKIENAGEELEYKKNKLEDALRLGIITEEEYEHKIRKLNE